MKNPELKQSSTKDYNETDFIHLDQQPNLVSSKPMALRCEDCCVKEHRQYQNQEIVERRCQSMRRCSWKIRLGKSEQDRSGLTVHQALPAAGELL